MTWPVVVAAGGPRERGRAYGAAARDRVHGSIELYEAVFAHYTGFDWAAVRQRAGTFVEAIESVDVQLLPELEGIAEGAGVDAEDVLALNVRTEVMYGLGIRAKECTSLALTGSRSADGHVLLAQTWDWKPKARETCVLLVMAPHDRPGFVTLVEAGLLAKVGMNASGLGVVTNALVSSEDRGRPGAPYHAILRRILTSRSLAEAVDAVRRPVRASSANYLIGSADEGIVDAEAAPGGPDLMRTIEGEALFHTNHFLRPDRPFKDLSRLDGPDSPDRYAAVEAAVEAKVEANVALGLDTVIDLLQGHADAAGGDGSVCAHGDPSEPPEADYVTISAVAMDLTAGRLQLTDGNPCTSNREVFEVNDLLSRAGPVDTGDAIR